MEAFEFIIVIILGFGIGVLCGMFGIGGGGLIVPVLHLMFGLPILASTSTSLLTIAPTGLSGAFKHVRQKTISIRTGCLVGAAGAVASTTGSLAADRMPEFLVVALTATVILFSVCLMIRTVYLSYKADRIALESSTEKSPEANDEQLMHDAESNLPQKSRWEKFGLPIVIGLIAGSIAGIVGVGGGFIIIPFCVSYLGFSLKKAAGTSLIAIAIIAIPGIITHALLGHIEWMYGLAIIIGTIPGAQVGATLINRLPERPMRIAFCCLLAVLGTMMLLQEFVF